MNRIKDLLLLIRPYQWVKNAFIFLPLFFDRHIADTSYWLPTIFSFCAFCASASAIYCFNDIHDADADRLHPKKCKRPIASGNISKSIGYIIMAIMILISLLFIKICPTNNQWKILSIIIFYLIMNIAYCIKLKRIAIIDTIIIAIGFVLRILIGGFTTDIWISEWLILMTFLLALFLAFAKRRDDVVIYTNTGVKARSNINRYNLEFMNQAMSIIAATTIVCYIMYTVSAEVINRIGSPYLYMTSCWVIAGILRYLQITIVDVKSGSPTKVLMKDKFIQLCIVGWILSYFIILYLK